MGKCWLVASVILFRLVFSMHASEREFCNCEKIPRSLSISVYNRNEDLVTLNKDITIGEKDKIRPGDVIKFRCHEGLTLIGASYLTCNGPDWSGAFPKCEKKLCSWPNSMEIKIEFNFNGSQILDFSNVQFPIGTTLKYIDKKQFRVEGYCQDNGTWNLAQPNCYQDPPEITQKPHDVAVCSGVVAAFYCCARGEPTPTISWRKNGRKLLPQSSRHTVFQQLSMSVLRIESARIGKDDAKYECVVENGVGDAVTASATLSIYPEADSSTIRCSNSSINSLPTTSLPCITHDTSPQQIEHHPATKKERLSQENGTWSVSQPNCNIIDELTTESQLATNTVADLAHECGNYCYNSYVTWGFVIAVFSAVFTCSLLIFTIIIFILMRRYKLNCFEKFTRSILESSVDNGASERLGPNSRIPETGHYEEAEPLASGYEIPRALHLAEMPVQHLDSTVIYEEITLNPK